MRKRNGWCFWNVRVTVFMLNGCAVFGTTLVAEAPTVWQVNYISYSCYYKLSDTNKIRASICLHSKALWEHKPVIFYVPIISPLFIIEVTMCIKRMVNLVQIFFGSLISLTVYSVSQILGDLQLEWWDYQLGRQRANWCKDVRVWRSSFVLNKSITIFPTIYMPKSPSLSDSCFLNKPHLPTHQIHAVPRMSDLCS